MSTGTVDGAQIPPPLAPVLSVIVQFSIIVGVLDQHAIAPPPHSCAVLRVRMQFRMVALLWSHNIAPPDDRQDVSLGA